MNFSRSCMWELNLCRRFDEGSIRFRSFVHRYFLLFITLYPNQTSTSMKKYLSTVYLDTWNGERFSMKEVGIVVGNTVCGKEVKVLKEDILEDYHGGLALHNRKINIGFAFQSLSLPLSFSFSFPNTMKDSRGSALLHFYNRISTTFTTVNGCGWWCCSFWHSGPGVAKLF